MIIAQFFFKFHGYRNDCGCGYGCDCGCECGYELASAFSLYIVYHERVNYGFKKIT